MKATPLKILGSFYLLMLAACSGEAVGTAKYAADQCRRVALIDAGTGQAIVGAEDFALDPEAGRLFISAYDRRAVEKAARKKANALPQGGVYAVPLETLFGSETQVANARSLAAPRDIAGGLRPHGLSYDAANHELVFINRVYKRDGRKWKMTPRLQRIGANGEMFVGDVVDAPCAANDVLATGDRTFASFDHGACDWRAGLENALRLKRSGLATVGGERLFERAAFANGLALTLGGEIAMAATRENALLLLKENDDYAVETGRIALPGGPDNLTLAHGGGIVAAVHPSLHRLALNRRLGIGRAPSRIVKADPDTGAVELLFDDPSGDLFSAATVGVETEDGLVAGSVTDEGVLVCKGAP